MNNDRPGEILDDKLSAADWREIQKYKFTLRCQKIIDYYKNNHNKPTSFNKLLALRVVPPGTETTIIDQTQTVFNARGGKYGLRRKFRKGFRRDKYNNPFRIYKINR